MFLSSFSDFDSFIKDKHFNLFSLLFFLLIKKDIEIINEKNIKSFMPALKEELCKLDELLFLFFEGNNFNNSDLEKHFPLIYLLINQFFNLEIKLIKSKNFYYLKHLAENNISFSHFYPYYSETQKKELHSLSSCLNKNIEYEKIAI